MKITLIRPNIGRFIKEESGRPELPFPDGGRMEPLELATLAALTPPDVEVAMYDDRIEEIPYDEPTDLAAISVEIFSARRAYEISSEFRKRGTKVILGGIHVSLVPEEASLYADSVFIGDAEPLWKEVILDCRSGKLKPFYHSVPGIPHPGVLPRREIFRNKKYLPFTLIQFGRGCPYGCSFCAISSYFDKKHFYRKIDEVVREITLSGNRIFFFVDDNITANTTAAKELFRALIPLKIKWIGQSGLNMTEDRELMSLMEKSGSMGHVIGFESITGKGIETLNKNPNIPGFNGYKEQIRILNDYNQGIWAAFTIGHDEETPETIDMTLDFALEHKFPFAAFNILMPYPKTPLYEQLQKENRLLFDGKWYLHPDYHFNQAAFIPRHMSPEELTRKCYEIKLKWNSFGSVFTRIFHYNNLRSLAKFAFVSQYNFLFRKESLRKQFVKLGYKTGNANRKS